MELQPLGGLLEPHSFHIPRGRRGRGFRLAFLSIFSVVPMIFVLGVSPDPVLLSLALVSAIAVVPTVWSWFRLPFTDPRIDGDRIIVNSWFSRQALARDRLVRFRAEEQRGFASFFTWEFFQGVFRSGELHAELSDGTTTRLKGTMCSFREARRMAEAANRWLGIEVGAGTGPRRRLRTQPGEDEMT